MYCKICPVCGKINRITSTICENEECMESLLDVEITDSELTNQKQTKAEAASQPKPVVPRPAAAPGGYMRKCPKCGRVYPYRFNQCECGTSLYGVPPFIPDQAPATAPALETVITAAVQPEVVPSPLFCFRSEDGQCRINLSENSDIVIGRTGEGAAYLTNKGFVSRQHARIVVRGGTAVIYSLSQTNPTLVNGKAIMSNHAYELKEKDLIALGAQPGQSNVDNAAYFRLIKA